GGCRPGDYLSARGESVAKWNLPLDDLFLTAHATRSKKKAAVTTLAIGDGGNEIGMGSARARIARAGALMARIASVVAVDHLVVAGTSNWGAYGVVAALERLHGRLLLHPGAIQRPLIARCVETGAVDGITRKHEPTVDGLGAEIHAGIVELLHAAGRMRAAPRSRGMIRR